MKKKSLVYLIMGILGIALIVSFVILNSRVSVSDSVRKMLLGGGIALAGEGIFMWFFLYLAKKDPVKWKQHQIDSNDERNVAIRFKAQAISGEVLYWTVIAAAWIAVFLDAPLWVILVTVGIFLFKKILELCLMARYQKEM